MSLTREEAREHLQGAWRECMNLGTPGQHYVHGYVVALRQVGLFDPEDVDTWMERVQRCPENTVNDPGHIGGRGWCGYCGDCDESTGDEPRPAEHADDEDPDASGAGYVECATCGVPGGGHDAGCPEGAPEPICKLGPAAPAHTCDPDCLVLPPPGDASGAGA